MPYKLAIFDFDGTLVDSLPVLLDALDSAAARYGFRTIDPHDLAGLGGQGFWQFMEHIDVATWQLPMIAQHVRERISGAVDTMVLFPGMHEALEDLAARDVRISIVSSTGEAEIRRTLGPRLASLVCDYRCDVSMFGKRPRLRQVLGATGTSAGDAVAIGDELRDLSAARAEEIPFAAAAWGRACLRELEGAQPDHVIRHVDDIVATVLGS